MSHHLSVVHLRIDCVQNSQLMSSVHTKQNSWIFPWILSQKLKYLKVKVGYSLHIRKDAGGDHERQHVHLKDIMS